MLTTFDDDEYIVEALRNGASGYLLKNIPPDRIIQGIKTVHDGNMLIHPDIARKLTGMLRPTVQPAPKSAELEQFGLTPTEKKVVVLIAEGLSNKEIAGQLYLSEGTVKTMSPKSWESSIFGTERKSPFLFKKCRANSIYSILQPKRVFVRYRTKARFQYHDEWKPVSSEPPVVVRRKNPACANMKFIRQRRDQAYGF